MPKDPIKELFRKMPELNTERLLLRRVHLKDAADLFEYARDPEVARFVTWKPHQKVSDTKKAIVWFQEQYAKSLSVSWGLLHRAHEKVIGTCGFVAISVPDERAEIGYAMSRDYWGKGYMSEAVRAVLQYGFETMKLNRIEAKVDLENNASSHLLEKMGMKYEGILRQYVFCKGEHLDLRMYSLLRSEWVSGAAGKKA